MIILGWVLCLVDFDEIDGSHYSGIFGAFMPGSINLCDYVSLGVSAQ